MAEIAKVALTPYKIKLMLPDTKYENYALSLAGKVELAHVGEYVYSMSTQNLERIFKVFNGQGLPKAVVVSGQGVLDNMRSKWRSYQNWKKCMQDILKVDQYPIEPNGKFAPYKHQTKIVGTVMVHPYPPVFADCGTGKTGSMLRAIELAIANKEINKGKTLISSPLSILQASWADDAKKFTNLSYKVLWTNITNKTKKVGSPILIKDLGSDPPGALTIKKKKKMMWVNGDKLLDVKKLDAFTEAEGGWFRAEVSFKEAIMPDGSKIMCGPAVAQVTEKDNTREDWIREALKADVDIFLINHDGVRIYEDILKQHKFEMVVVDESTKIKSIQSQITQSHIDISWDAKRRVILSGTPNPNGFIDLWSQFYFLDRGLTLFSTLKDFRHAYFNPIRMGHFGGHDAVKWEIKEDKKQELIDLVKDSSIFLKQRDCVDLPPITDLNREVMMTSEQSKIYKKMEEELVAEFLDHKSGSNVMVEAMNTLSKLLKLRQITSGFVGHSGGQVASITSTFDNPKFGELDDFIEELQGQKLVVACQFREEIHHLLTRYSGRYGIAAIYGDEPLARRTENINKFQQTNEIQIMVLQPQAAAHGITLTEAHYFVFLSLDYNFEYYYQTRKRIERIGQKNSMFVYHFLAKTDKGKQTIDHDLMWVLKMKSVDRDSLFNETTDILQTAEDLKNRLIERVKSNKE